MGQSGAKWGKMGQNGANDKKQSAIGASGANMVQISVWGMGENEGHEEKKSKKIRGKWGMGGKLGQIGALNTILLSLTNAKPKKTAIAPLYSIGRAVYS